MRHGPPTSSNERATRRASRAAKRGGRARRALGTLTVLLCACAGPDAAPLATELIVSSADGPSASPRCRLPRGAWRVRYRVSDPGTSCALLLRDEVHDFDATDAGGEADCQVKREGPDEGCRFHEVRRCTGTLGGSRYDSVVWRSFGVVDDDRLEGRGVASGGSSVLGLCQTTFTYEATPK